MIAIAINLYGVARAFTGGATVFAAVACPTATGWVLTDSFILIISHLASSSINLIPCCLAQHLAHPQQD